VQRSVGSRCRSSGLATGQLDAARAVWSQTVELRAALGDPDPVDVRSRLVALDRQAAAAGYGNG
jgi:hypothetical protein